MKQIDVPRVYCVIAVHNRLEITKRCLDYIQAQDYQDFHIVIIDDGSTDGTGEYLAQHKLANLTILKGDGNLWWGGSMHLGIKFAKGLARKADYLLMLNDDVSIDCDYISNMVKESISNNTAIVGSTQCDETTGEIMGCGYQIDYWKMRIIPLDCSKTVKHVDALPGRGVLIPMAAVQSSGNLRTWAFPHYFGDIEYTCRLRENGWKIKISQSTAVYTSSKSSDVDIRKSGLIAQYFSIHSKTNLIHRLLFFSLSGPLLLRFIALPRYLLIEIWILIKRIWEK